jgi:hypothetical protein
MNFSQALEELKRGKRVKRSFWGGYWFIPESLPSGYESFKYNKEFKLNCLIVARLKDDGGYAPAQPYQADLLADDWEVIE